MAVSVKKLKVGRGKLSAADIVGYLSDPQDVGDYYTEDSQAFMSWIASDRVRTLFALGDEVQQSTLRNLIEGVDPVTGELIRRYGPDGTIVGAIDVTLSPAPKSVSILWALADDVLRYELETMVAGSVAAAVGRMLREQPLIRERHARHVAPAVADDYVGARVMHTAARLSVNGDGVPDPQLHVHNLLVGAVDEQGRLRAIDSLAILRYQAELDAEASGHLAHMLRMRGFPIERRVERRPNGQVRVSWEIGGVPPSLIEAMSSRTAEIEDLKRRYRDEYGREPVGHAWDAWVVLQRGPKARLTSAELRAAWALEAERHGFDHAAVLRLLTAADRRRTEGVEAPDEDGSEAAELRRLLLENVCRDHAFVPFQMMERLARQLAVGLLDPRTTDLVIAEMIGDGDLLVTDDDQVTTLEVLRNEQRARAAAAELLDAPPSRPVPGELVDEELERRSEDGRPFDERQAAAIRLATGGARFVSITGPAGTGKGYAASAMTALWHRQGRRVLAAAVAGRTAQQAAADAGADEALNLDLLRVRVQHGLMELTPNDVILVDEAGMVDHARYAPLLEAVAVSGATLVQVGDDHQLSPVGPGGLWTVTHAMAASAGQAVELDVVRRARDRREAAAWSDLRHGRIVQALTWMRDEQRLRLYESRQDLLQGVVDAWWSGDRDGLMVVDTSNAERDRLNELAQARRLGAGELGPEVMVLSDGRTLRRGDRVLFNTIYRPPREPGSLAVRRVENGTSGVVVKVDALNQRAVLELRDGDGVRRLEVGREVPVELGYARHVTKAQGVTHEDTDVAVSRQTRRNALYVMATRARAGARFHAVAAELGEVVGELEGGVDPATAPMTEAQSAVLERGGVKLDPGWSWVQASLRIDDVIGAPSGRQAALWLQAMGYQPDEAAAIVERAREPERREPAASGTGPDSGVVLAGDLVAEVEAERARRLAVEGASIRAIHRQAEPSSTKEALGERHIRSGALRREAHSGVAAARLDADRGEFVASGMDAERKWTRSLRLDREAPAAARHTAGDAAPRRPYRAPERPPAPMPARDLRESVLGRRDASELPVALAYYQRVGRLEQTADPAARAAGILAADPQAVVVAASADLWRRVRELAEKAGVGLEVDGRPRVLQGDAAYRARQERREEWLAGRPVEHAAQVEPDAIANAYVVTDDQWESTALAKAISVAAESHVVLPELHPYRAREVAAGVERLRAAEEARNKLMRARSAASARDAAYERGAEAERAADRAAAHQAERDEAGC